ncbi:MAG: SpoIID/LytB domain-containing protein [bacterium]|nr:SpoIID/LytB domain-containing protein [bacterium]
MRKLLLLLLAVALVLLPIRPIAADELDDLQKQIDDLARALQMSQDATKPLEGELGNLQAKLDDLFKKIEQAQAAIDREEKQLKDLQRQIQEEQKLLDLQQQVFTDRVRSYYMYKRKDIPFYLFLSSGSVGSFFRAISYRESAAGQDKDVIVELSDELRGLHTKKVEAESLKFKLEQDQKRFFGLKAQADERAAFLKGEVGKARAYQTKLSQQIASLTSRQQEILSARSGTFTTSIGDVPLTDDSNASPTFNPGFSPAFAGFSFGAFSHWKGMSQYGAKGRAERGHDYKAILRAYYGKDPETKDTGGTISVEGFGTVDFEGYYLLGIAEMPSTFPKEALKAQAVAARSYAMRYKTNGTTICVTESCQVFSNSKAANPPAEWKQAVEETRGQIVEGVTAFYSSTTGGYIDTMGWDTTCGGKDCWTGEAYEKIANSPWFYKGWYTQSYPKTSANCGRSHPWLTQEEFADILNGWLVRKAGSSDDVARILPTTIGSCALGGSGGNPYSMDALRQKADELGGAYTSVSSVSISYSGDGRTANVRLQTNRGAVDIPGSEFKDTFNLRAPGYIAIRSKLFNIEQK